MKFARSLGLIVLMAFALTACDNTEFTSVWRDPAAQNIDLRGEVAGFLLSGNTAVRRSFEDFLAKELNERGIEAVAGYEVLPNGEPIHKEAILSQLKDTTADYGVFMRIVDRRQEISYVPGTTWYGTPYDDPFWWYAGRYYGPGFNRTWPAYYDPGYYTTDTVVSVETLVYSVPDSKLLWAGLSKTMNPSKVESFVKDLVSATVDQLEKTENLRQGD